MLNNRRRSRLIPGLWLVALPIALGCLIGGVSYQRSRELLLQAQDRTRAALATGLAVGLTDSLVVKDYAAMESRLLQAMADPTIASALVVDTSGSLLVHLQRPNPSDPPVLQFTPSRVAIPGDDERTKHDREADETRWTPVSTGASTVGWLRLRTIASSTDVLLDLLWKQYLILALISATVFAVLMVAGYRQLKWQIRKRESHQLEERIRLDRSAHTDALTGAWNRRGIEREMQRILKDKEQRSQARLGICMIDLDEFKPVNDSFGHEMGDRLLVAVTRRLQGFLREGDLIGRLGGDEFIAVFHGCLNEEIALKLANRVLAGLQSPFYFDHLDLRISASIGIVLDGDNQEESLANLMKQADQAMYVSKHRGKGQVVLATALCGTDPFPRADSVTSTSDTAIAADPPP